MTSQIVALLASAGLVTAGVAATAETRSATAIPSVTATQVLPVATGTMMGQAIDCSLDQNKNRSECTDEGAAAAGGHSGLIIGGLVAVVGAAGLLVALKKDSNG